MPFVPVADSEEPRRGFTPLPDSEPPTRGLSPVQAAPALSASAPIAPANPIEPPASGPLPAPALPVISGRQQLIPPGTRLPSVAAPASQEVAGGILPKFLKLVTPRNPALEVLNPAPRERLPETVLADMRKGQRSMTPAEFGGVVRALEAGKIENPDEVRNMLSLSLSREGLRYVDQAILTRKVLDEQKGRSGLFGSPAQLAAAEGFVRGATMNNVESPQALQETPEGQAIARAMEVSSATRRAEHPVAALAGEGVGSTLPFMGGAKLLRLSRALPELAAVRAEIAGIRGGGPSVALTEIAPAQQARLATLEARAAELENAGVAPATRAEIVGEGAAVGGPQAFGYRPDGSADMSPVEELQARALQTGVGVAAGAVLDFGTSTIAQFAGRYASAMRDRRFARALEQEAKSKGFDNPDDYVAALVEFKETPDGVVVSPRAEVAQKLPDMPGEARPAEASAPEGQAPAPAASAPEGETPAPGFTPLAEGEQAGTVLPRFDSEYDLELQQHAEKARKHNLTPEAEADFRPKERRDLLTGFQMAWDRPPTVQRAIDYVATHNTPGHYLLFDLHNLAGLNAKYGEVGANKVYRDLARIAQEEVEGVGGHAQLFRHGGDEMSGVVLGVDREAIEQALQRMDARAQTYAKERNLHDLPHKKGDAPGVGLHFVVTPIKKGDLPEDVMSIAGVDLEAAKVLKKELYNVNRIVPEEAQPPGPSGQAGGVQGVPAPEAGRGGAGPAAPGAGSGGARSALEGEGLPEAGQLPSAQGRAAEFRRLAAASNDPTVRTELERLAAAADETSPPDEPFTVRSPEGTHPYTADEPAIFLPVTASTSEHRAVTRSLGQRVRHIQTGTFPSGISRVASSADVAHVVAPIRRDAQESFFAVVTDDAGQVLRVASLHRGTQGKASIDPALVAGAITSTPKGTRAWISHNHPSGFPMQSEADRAITAQVGDLLRGSGVELQGSVVMAPGGRVHSVIDAAGNERIEPTTAAPRRGEVPVTERRIVGKASQAEPIETAKDAERALDQHGGDQEGVLLLDDDNRPLRWVPLSSDEMRELRTGRGGALDKLLTALDETNASGMVARADKEAAAGNLSAFAAQTGRELLDVISRDGRSVRSSGDFPSQSTFYANPFFIGARDFARDVGMHPGRNVASGFAGGVYGATESDAEVGTAQWWLDVGIGAAGGMTLAQAMRATKLLGKGSIADAARVRLGNWIESLPLIGRGSAEVRELKAKQRLMKQILDRQTAEVGKALQERFTPAERAMMADLIEKRGIVKDLNLIHRQAQALDDYITAAAERMKALKMLPEEMETGGYLHRYYAKHLGLDKLFQQAKGQTLHGSYTIARGTDDVFGEEFFSPGARAIVAQGRPAKRSEAVELVEFVGEQNGKVRSFFFAPDEVPRVDGRLGQLDNVTGLAVPGTPHLSPTDRRWTVVGKEKSQVMLHRDWTDAERASWGEIKDAGYRYVRGMAEVSHDLSLATLFDTVARRADWVSEAPKNVKGKDWVLVPETRVHKNSPLKKYGTLAGKYVDPAVWAGIRNYGRAPFGEGPIGNVYRGFLSRWKLYKTVYNPVTHFNNTASNVEMLYLAGYNGGDLYQGVKQLWQGEKSAIWREARDAGLFGDDWTSSLLKSEGGGTKALADLAEKLRNQPEIPDAQLATSVILDIKDWWVNSAEAVRNAPTKLQTGAELAKAMGAPTSGLWRFIKKPVDVAADSAQRLYRFEDNIFKMAVFSAARKQGRTPAEAVRDAQAFFFDYSDLPEAVKIVRDFPVGSPFISYTYMAIPAVARHLVQHPERVLSLVAGFEAINYGVMASEGVEPGEYWATVDAEETVSPAWERGRSLWGALNTIHLPSPEGYRLAVGRAHVIGNPFMDDAGGREKLPTVGHAANFWGSSMFGSNPLHAVLDVLVNEDWKGKEIYAPGAPEGEKVRATMAYLYQAWAPSHPAMPGSYNQTRILEGMANDQREAAAQGERTVIAPVVEAANGVAGDLGLQGFTGLDRAGNPILTRDALASAFGVKLRPIRWAQSREFTLQDVESELTDKERFLDAQGRLKQEGRITPERFQELRDTMRQDSQELLGKRREVDAAKAVIEEQGRWR